MARDGLLIIGYGNTLRGDDGAGPRAAALLAQLGFHALAMHQLTPELAQEVAAAHTVVFVDADAQLPRGEVRVERLAPVPQHAGPLEHHATPAGILHLADMAYAAQPEAWLIAVGGSDFSLRDSLSPAAETAVSRAVEEIVRRAAVE